MHSTRTAPTAAEQERTLALYYRIRSQYLAGTAARCPLKADRLALRVDASEAMQRASVHHDRSHSTTKE